MQSTLFFDFIFGYFNVTRCPSLTPNCCFPASFLLSVGDFLMILFLYCILDTFILLSLLRGRVKVIGDAGIFLPKLSKRIVMIDGQ